MEKREGLENNKILNHIGIYTVIFMIVHGEMVFNKLSWYDDIGLLTGWFGSLSHGRFTLYVLTRITNLLFGGESLPVIHAIIGGICISAVGLIIFRMYAINSKISQFALMIVLISIPAVTGNLGYTITSGYNFIGLLITVFAAYLAVHFNDILHFILSAIIFALAIGEYQCYITFFISLLFLEILTSVFDTTNTLNDCIKKAIRYILISIFGLGIYLILLKLIMSLWNSTLSTYAGIESFGITTFIGYIERIRCAYYDFFIPSYSEQIRSQCNMFPFRFQGWHIMTILLLLAGTLFICVHLVKEHDYYRVLLFIGILILSPIVFGFNYIMYGFTSYVHALHMYHYVIYFVMIVVIWERGIDSFDYINNRKDIIKRISAVFVLFIGLLYVQYDNLCYVSAELRQQQAISYFTTLASDIHNTVGYYKEMPITYVNKEKMGIDPHHMLTDTIVTNPYSWYFYNDNYIWDEFMYEWCDIKGNVVEQDFSKEMTSQITSMPSYPDYGSIRVINGVLIVKF